MGNEQYGQLMALNATASDLNAVVSLLGWDQETYMPPKGLAMRARQIKTLSSLLHERRTDPQIGRLLEALETQVLDDTQRLALREQKYDYDRQRKLPVELVADLAETTSLATESWRVAREKKDFNLFAPSLEKVLGLLRRQADAYGYGESPYDALIEDYERGMTASKIRAIFTPLRESLSRMIQAIGQSARPPRKEVLHRHFDPAAQWDFGMGVLRDMGFDLEAGRQDRSAHPFTSGTYPADVRLTTRIFADHFFSGLSSTMHEGGHGLYEQGFRAEHIDTVLAAAPSLGLHESQSRLWENQVGRSLPFWRRYFPLARERFAEALGDVDLEAFYAAINTVEPSFIRVEADEATYPLHIILRFELEQALMEGDVSARDLPDLWNEKMQSLLGITPPDAAQGVLQDIHWSHGLMGYFPTYALGNLYSAQIFATLRRDIPDVDQAMERGELTVIRDWLSDHIYAAGRTMLAKDLIRQVCGEGINERPFLEYVARKYGAIYDVDLMKEV